MLRRHLIQSGLAAFALAGCDIGELASGPGLGSARRREIKGTGRPTVVFESGLGDGLASWNPVFGKVAQTTRAFRYSRPGYATGDLPLDGWNSDRDGERTGGEIARHLRAHLRDQGLEPPYLLVGHSIGGTYVLAFAKAYPQDIAGIVLVDGRLPGFAGACATAGLGPCTPKPTLLQPWHIRAEMKGIPTSEAAAATARSLGAVPITLIAATKPPAGANPTLQKIWLRSQRSYAKAARNGRFVEATGAGHYIHRDRPQLVLREIDRMVSLLRSG